MIILHHLLSTWKNIIPPQFYSMLDCIRPANQYQIAPNLHFPSPISWWWDHTLHLHLFRPSFLLLFHCWGPKMEKKSSQQISWFEFQSARRCVFLPIPCKDDTFLVNFWFISVSDEFILVFGSVLLEFCQSWTVRSEAVCLGPPRSSSLLFWVPPKRLRRLRRHILFVLYFVRPSPKNKILFYLLVQFLLWVELID